MKIIYENCGVKNYMKEIHRHFCSFEKKAWKNSGWWDSNPWPLRYRCGANKPTWSRSLNWFVINPWKDKDEVMNIWKSYMRTAGWRIKWKRITGRQVYVIEKVSNYSWQKLISSLLYFDFQRYLRVTLINCMGFCFLPWIVLILTRFERALSLLVQVTSQRCHWPLKLMTSKAEQRWTGIGMGSRIG